jgi:predicted methyltransferase
MPEARLLQGHRIRLVLFLLSAIVVFTTMYVLYSAIATLRQLEVVESERDQWQRPAEVLQALDLRPGDVVVDLGSGAGYFALKLSPIVGPGGQVLAVDIRRLPLAFLWVRALTQSRHNLHVVYGDPDDPRLPTGNVDGVLIANTYHELADREAILNRALRALRPGGRLVIVDRGAEEAYESQRQGEAHHELSPAVAEDELRQRGFDILSRQDRFIDWRGTELWWLIIARRPLE